MSQEFRRNSQDGGKTTWSNSVSQQPPGEVLVGSKDYRGPDGDFGTRDIIGLENMLSVSHVYSNLTGTYGIPFYKTAIMSLDGLIRPVSLDGDGYLPMFAQNAAIGANGFVAPPSVTRTGVSVTGASGEPSIPEDYYDVEVDHVDIYQPTLNPLANPTGLNWAELHTLNPSGGTYVGHDIDIIGRGIGIGNGPGTRGLPMMSTYSGGIVSGQADYADDYRFFALRGPVVMQGWGYTTDGYPIPNAADSLADANDGIFTTENQENYFLDGWLQKSNTWPVGPVDLRWDNTRKVWTAAHQYELRTGLVLEGIEPYAVGWIEEEYSVSFSGVVMVSGATGIGTSRGFSITSPVGAYLPSGTNIVARYNGTDTYDVIDYMRWDRCKVSFPSGGMSILDSTGIVDISTVINGTSPGDSVVAYNTHHWSAGSGDTGRIEFNYGNRHWELYQLDC